MGGGWSKQKTNNDSDLLSLPDEEIYNEEAREAADFVLKKKNALQTRIELTISCQNLPKLDFLSQTDAKVVCYIEEAGNFFRFDSTEVIPDCPDPCFEHKIVVPYNFEKPQTLRFEIYDVDEFKEQDLLDKQELIGHVETTLHQIVCSPDQTLSKDIIGNKTRKNRARKCGTLTVSGKEIDESNNKISFQVTLSQFTSRSDSKLELVAYDNADSVLKIFELRPLNKKGVEWNLTLVPYKTPTLENSKLKFKVIERVKSKRAVFGEVEANISEVLNNGGAKFRIRKKDGDVGDMKLKELKRTTRYTFLNYVDSGAEISLIIAIDFTKSNREPTDPKSLHYCMSDQDNEYLQALKSIGGILQYYDSDNKIPLYGFGAKMPPYFNTVSNCFSLNGNYFDPEVYGLDEVIKTYKDALTKYKFHGPTIFSELLRMATEYTKAEATQDENQKYFILLILTDGDIDDFEKTKDEVVKASELPMSIIIIGVGDHEFTQMQVLDGDDGELVGSDGVEGHRDIVQFVPFSKYKHDPQQLAKKTLEEVPKQFLEYMRANNIEPLKNSKKTRFAGRVGIEDADKSALSKPKLISDFLTQEKERFMRELMELEIDPKLANRILEEGIPAPIISLVIEMISNHKDNLMHKIKNISGAPSIEVDIFKDKLTAPSFVKSLKKGSKVKTRQFKSHLDSTHAFEDLMKKDEAYKIAYKIINYKAGTHVPRAIQEREYENEEEQESEYSNRLTVKMPNVVHKRKVFVNRDEADATEHFKVLTRDHTPLTLSEKICLHCQNREINTVLMPCGHAAFCGRCLDTHEMKSCKICKQHIKYYTVTKTDNRNSPLF